jgi:S1-C subfamily serine protease
VWLTSDDARLKAGAIMFTTDGSVAGVVVRTLSRMAIVPAGLIIDRADALMERDVKNAGEIGLAVQALTEPLARATGADSGVVVTWADPSGPSAGVLRPGDVIERVNDTDTPSLAYWTAAIRRVDEDDLVRLRVRSPAGIREVSITAAPARANESPRRDSPPLGLRMRRVENGTEVLAVADGSAAARAGLRRRDVITHIGERTAPLPAQIIREFAEMPNEMPLIVAITRDGEHHVLAIER